MESPETQEMITIGQEIQDQRGQKGIEGQRATQALQDHLGLPELMTARFWTSS